MSYFPLPFHFYIFFLLLRPPPRPPLFPYTTLFRSDRRDQRAYTFLTSGQETDGLTFGELDQRARAIGARLQQIGRSEEHTSELQSPCNLVCRLLLEKKKST